MKYWTIPTLSLLLVTSTALSQSLDPSKLFIDSSNGPNPWSSISLNNHPDQFQFAIMTDRTGGHRSGVFMQGIKKVNLLQPEFVMSVGDLIEGYTEDRAVLNTEWDEFEGFISHLTMPFFYLPGNHDMTNEVMAQVWKARFGRSYYHFIYKDVLFLCLNSEDLYRGAGKGSISDPQFKYFTQVLEKYSDVRHTMIFMHQPLWNQADPERWPDVEKMLADRPHTVFVGHNHNYVKEDRNNGKYFILATTGGGSALRGPVLGEFDHVVWVTMKDDGPVITNLLLDGILHEDILMDAKKDFLSSLSQEPIIEVEPYFSENAFFEEGIIGFNFTNRQSIPMSINTVSGFGWDLSAHVEDELFTLAPHSTKLIEVSLRNKHQTRIDDIRPLPLKFNLHFDVPDLGSVEIPASYQIKPIYKKYVNRVNNPISIDGNLDDWNNLPHDHQDLSLSDNRINFGMSYDDQYLYLAADISDDTILVNTKLPSWKQDGFGWFIKMGTDHSLATATRSSSFRITPSHGSVPQSNYRSEHWPSDLNYVAKSNGKGYSLELRIPITFLHEGPDPWTITRINFFVDDKDSEGDPVRLNWQPPWRGSSNFVGTGMFFRK